MTEATLTPEAVREVLRRVKDPELDLNIMDLGLVYDVEIEDGNVEVTMTLTSPGCPAGPMITNDVYREVRTLEGVKDAARDGRNLVPPMIGAVEAFATVGEIADALRGAFGEYRETAAL